MKLSALLIVTVLLSISFNDFVVVVTAVTDDHDTIVVFDKKRPGKVFNVNTKRSSGQYSEMMKIITESQMTFDGQSIDSTSTIQTYSDVSVTDTTTGGSHIGVTITRMMMHMETAGFTQECDTSIDKKVAGLLCTSLYDVLDAESNFDLDKDGNIISASGPGSDIAKKEAVLLPKAKQISTVPTTDTGSADYKQSWTQTSRLLQLVPAKKEVKAGDVWDSSVYFGELGQLNGTGTMLGYRTIDDVDCAVFSVIGTLHVNYNKMTDMVSNNEMMSALVHDTDISDSMIDALVYYDYENGLVRWSKTHLQSTVTMPDIMGEGTLTFPMDTTSISTCRVK